MMQDTLFPDERHDAGGKVKTKLPAGMFGDAKFWGERDAYRPLLRRWIGREEFKHLYFPTGYALFIGMNPSVADADANDPTITREWGFSARHGFSAYVKCNLSDYRATDPKQLLAPGLQIQSPANFETIVDHACRANLVVAAWGGISKPLQPLAKAVRERLEYLGIPMYCLGRTADGHPRHPLYLKSSAQLERY